MSGPIKVTFAELGNAQGSIQQAVGAVNSQLDDLKTYLAPLVATWEGSAAEAYNTLQRQWDTAAAELNQVLAQVGTAVGTANDSYQAAEASNANRFA